MAKPRKDIIGMTIGYWTILSGDDDRMTPTGVKRVVVAKCKCGTVRSILEQNLLSKRSLSCGCYQREKARDSLKSLWKKRKERSVSS